MMISNYDIVVFDMEDVLVDQGSSLGAAVSRAVDVYLTSLLGVKPEGGPVFPVATVHEFLEANGFSPDEDGLNVLLAAALNAFQVEFQENDLDACDSRDMLDEVRNSGRIDETLGGLAARTNLAEFGKALRGKGMGKRAFQRMRGLRNRFLSMAEGHILMDNFVKRVLAETYLGEELFQKEYNQPLQFVTGEGTIAGETGWVEPGMMAEMRKRSAMACITSRTQAEAQYVLNRIDIARYIDAVVSQDMMPGGAAGDGGAGWFRDLGVGGDTTGDYPIRLNEAIERVRIQEGIETMVRAAYVGNCAVDSRGLATLKERFRMTLIGCVFGQDRKALPIQKEKGADVTAAEPAQLVRILTERPRPRSFSEY